MCDRPTDRRQSTLGKAPKLCPGTVGRSFPEALSLPPSSSQGEAQGKGGTSLFPWMFKGNSLQGCSGKRSASGRRHQFKCGQRANRAAAVHTFTVWAGMLSIRGRGTPFAPMGWGSGGGCSRGALPWHPCGPLLGGLIYIGTAPRARKAQRGHGAPCRGYHSRMVAPTAKKILLGAWGVV